MVGFNTQYGVLEQTVSEAVRMEAIHAAVIGGEDFTSIFGVSIDSELRDTARLAAIDELRDQASRLRLANQIDQADRTVLNRLVHMPRDLVLLRRLQQDQQRVHKLEPRWCGPFELLKWELIEFRLR